MSLSRSMRAMLKESERAAKREQFDPSSVDRPSLPWLDLEVGDAFTISNADVSAASVRSGSYYWSQKSGRVFSISTAHGVCSVTRTA